MSRLPTSMDLGATRVVRPRVDAPVNRGAQIVADGTREAFDSVGRDVIQHERQDDEYNYAIARQKLLQADVGAREKFENDQNYGTFEERYTEQMKAAREDASQLIKGRRSRALFEADAQTDIARGTDQVRSLARVKEGGVARSTLDETLNDSRRTALLATDSGTRNAIMQGVGSSIAGARDKGFITPEQATNLSQAWSKDFGEGFVDMQPLGKQVELLRKPTGTPADLIDPAKRANLLETAENKMRIISDRRDARAERSVAQLERVISSGIPVSASMWADTKRTVDGTPSAADFGDLMKGEQEIQKTLRMPIADQLKLVQDRQTALTQNGGTLADASNTARLTNAVKQNIALLQSDPLVFGERRLGEKQTPVGAGDILDPSRTAEMGSMFQERAAQLKGLSKQFGVNLPMKPLLPQEAQQLGAMLDTASDKQSSDLFKKLRDASGTSDVFNGIMRQIAPDHPVKELAGRLSTARADLVTESNWFSPDTSVTSKDVSATLLRGDRILHPTKDEKGQDGDPKAAKLYLPSDAQTDLQAKFSAEVGDAFAGREGALDKAYQSVLAYYVGRSAEKGLVAADKTTVDGDLVNEAVRATLGNAVKYNGQGTVLAPWGMATSDFDDRVERAWRVQGKTLGLPPEINPDNDNFGLTNTATDGVYAITLGGNQNIPKNVNDQPFLLDLRTAGKNDKRGFIERP